MRDWVATEDPRIVGNQKKDCMFLTIHPMKSRECQIAVATSKDLRKLRKKHGPIFKDWKDVNTIIQNQIGGNRHRTEEGKLTAAKIDGKYWMYYGDASHLACILSEDFELPWQPVEKS